MVEPEAPGADPLGALADEFVERYRKGERPDLSEYTARHPEMADEIREMFPLLVMMEKAGTGISATWIGSAPPSRQIVEEEPVPDVIAGYKIQREIGRGGMGIVYEAEQIALRRHVALKVLPGHALQRNLGLERFQQEARVAACLHHTNIVPVYEVGEDNNTFFYSMQYIHGQSLDQVLRELRMARDEGDQATVGQQGSTQVSDPEPLSDVSVSLLHGFHPPGSPAASPASQEEPPSAPLLPGQTSRAYGRAERGAYHRSVARVGIQVAEALGYAHQNGILHRDIKPANLLLDVHSRVWITDFGLAKARDTELTSEGDVVGTMRYMGPERFRGECQAQSDLFSLGATLYEMLLLRPAFDALSHLALMHQITHEDPLPLRHVDPTIPRDLETIVLKCLEKAPRRRYGSAEEVVEDLKRFLEYQPIRARRITLVGHFWRWCRRNPVIAGLSLAVLLVTLAGIVGILIQWQRASANEQKAVRNEKNAIRKEREAKAHAREVNNQKLVLQEKKKTLEMALDRLERVTYNAKMNAAGYAWMSGAAQRVREHLNWYRTVKGKPDLRGFEWYYLHRICQANVLTLHGEDRPLMSIACRPNGKQIAGADSSGRLIIWNSTTGKIEKSFYPISPHNLIRLALISRIAYSRDSCLLAVAHYDRTISIFDAQTYQKKKTLKGLSNFARNLAFSPDGKFLATVSGTAAELGQLVLWDLESGKQKYALDGFNAGFGNLAYSSNGRYLAGVARERTVKILHAATGKDSSTIQLPSSFIHAIAFSPDSRSLALTYSSLNVQIWDIATGKRMKILNGPSQPMQSLAYSPDGKQIAAGAKSIHVWDVASGKPLVKIEQQLSTIRDIQYTPDGKRLIASTQEPLFRIWEASRSTGPFTFSAQSRSLKCMALSPNGKLIATCGHDRKIRIWSSTSGQQLHVYHSPGQVPVQAVFSPDSKALAVAGGDKRLYLWDVTKHRLAVAIPHRQALAQVALSPDGSYLVTATSDSRIHLWELSPKKPRRIKTLSGHQGSVQAMKFSPNGKLLATASDDKTVRLWNVPSGKEHGVLKGHQQSVRDVCFHPDGKRLFSGSFDRCIKIWDLSHRTEIATIAAHALGVDRLALSHKGHRLASSGADRKIKLWDLDLNEEVLTLASEDQSSTIDLAFDAEETRLITAWSNGILRIYSAPRP